MMVKCTVGGSTSRSSDVYEDGINEDEKEEEKNAVLIGKRYTHLLLSLGGGRLLRCKLQQAQEKSAAATLVTGYKTKF